jgi:eukaryotic-like serine/threonine-protein kinase
LIEGHPHGWPSTAFVRAESPFASHLSARSLAFPRSSRQIPAVPHPATLVTAVDSTLAAALSDRYVIERELGRGGMATVYLARDLRHDRPVALKLLHPELAATLGPERFQREIRLTARLDHPHILPVLDSGTAAGQLWYTMPYVRGESLRDRLRRESQLPIELALEITRQVASALDYAHREGVVHRDLKPENILLSEGQARVADFGVAKALALDGEELTVTGLAVGTPAYMSPEQATGSAVDARTDVYALGTVLYEMLAGNPPFTGRAHYALLAAHATEAPDPISKRRPSTSSRVAAVVMRCLEKNPADRPQTAAALLAELGTITTPESVSTVGTEVRKGSSVVGRQAWRVGIGLATLLLAGLVAVFWPRTTGAKSLDPNLVAVVPFRIAGADPSLAYLREGMLDLLAAKLTGDGGPRAADPRSVMSVWRRQVGDEQRDLPQDSAMLLARQLGAGRLLLGGIVGTGHRLVINASLLEVPGGGARAEANVAGSPDSLGVMIDRLTGELLAREAGEATQRVAELTTTSLPALRAYLQGQAAYRRGRYEEAVGWFERALNQDSTFALGALGLVYAGIWEAPATSLRAISIASRLRERLSARDRVILAAIAGSRYPAPYPFVQHIAGWERATEVLWDSPEAWYQLGDVLFHRAPVTDIGWRLQRAAAAFRRALELDSTFSAPLDHLVEIAVLTGDTAAVRHLGKLYVERFPESELADFVRWRMTVVLGIDSVRAGLRSEFDRMNIRSLTRIVALAQLSGIGLEDVEPAATALRREARLRTDDPEGAHWTLAGLALNQGRPSEAREAVEATGEFGTARQVLWNHVLNALLGEGDSAAAANAVRDLLRGIRATPAKPTDRAELNVDLCMLGLWQVHRTEWESARRMMARMLEPGVVAEVVPAWAPSQVCAAVIDASIAVGRKRTNARPALARADSLVSVGWFTSAPLNLILARLWEAEGDLPRALRAVRRSEYDDPTGPAYLGTRLRTEGRIAALAGDRGAAVRAYTHYLKLVNRPEPRVQPLVADVRKELARLVGEDR